MRVRHAGRAAALAALLALAGCAGDNTAEVSGTVTVDGTPAERGSITFIPTDGKSPTAGAEIKDGRYSARVPPGAAKVQVRVPQVTGRKKLYDTPDSPVQEVLTEVLPAKYNDQTELTLDVKPGSNEKNWDLKK